MRDALAGDGPPVTDDRVATELAGRLPPQDAS